MRAHVWLPGSGPHGDALCREAAPPRSGGGGAAGARPPPPPWKLSVCPFPESFARAPPLRLSAASHPACCPLPRPSRRCSPSSTLAAGRLPASQGRRRRLTTGALSRRPAPPRPHHPLRPLSCPHAWPSLSSPLQSALPPAELRPPARARCSQPLCFAALRPQRHRLRGADPRLRRLLRRHAIRAGASVHLPADCHARRVRDRMGRAPAAAVRPVRPVRCSAPIDARRLAGMFSWFPIYFPLVTPAHVPAGSDVVVHIWRCASSSKARRCVAVRSRSPRFVDRLCRGCVGLVRVGAGIAHAVAPAQRKRCARFSAGCVRPSCN